ncbi:MAG: hypothetical protein U0T75_00630 [Chitinophagales bacterium]
MESRDIINQSEAISLTGNEEAQQRFCELWPTVKGGLQMLVEIIKNPIAKAAIGVVISAGDAVAGRICG